MSLFKYLSFFFSFLIFQNIIAAERFPAIEPNASGTLCVDNIHQIYWEESGCPEGMPVLFLHGGPGVGTQESDRTFFDPHFYRIILFDQRGCGKSTPSGCLINNTTWDIVEDINKLREHLSIDKCILFGGSWGSTLALAYAIKYPENVSGLILRGIFLCRQAELNWFYKQGADVLSPKAWQKFIENIPQDRRDDLIKAYYEDLNSEAYFTKINAAATWVLWEFANLQYTPDSRLDLLLNSKFMFSLFSMLYASPNIIMAQIENHYFFHKGFFETDNWILENIDRIQNIPGIIIQGENDHICPWENAADLHQKWPASTFLLVPNAGHASTETGILDALIEATEEFKHR